MRIYDLMAARDALPRLGGVALLGLVLAGCASQGVPERAAGMRIDANPVQTPAATRRANYEYHVLAGEMAIQRDNREVAAREYVAALQYSNNAELARRASRIALYAGDMVLAYRATRAWAAAEQDSIEAQRTATRLALINEDASGLNVYAPALVRASASPDIGYRLLADVMSGQQNQADIAVAALSRIAERDSDSAAAHYALGVLALRYGRNDVAERAASRALALDPDWNEAILLQAGVWIRNGQRGRAQALVAQLPGNDATRAEYHMALARLLVEADQDEAALDEFQRALDQQPGNADARYGLAILSLSVGDLDRARDVFRGLYDSGERVDDTAYYLGTIAEQGDDFVEAQRWYQRVDNGEHAFDAQVRAARMMYRQDNLAGARRRLEEQRMIEDADKRGAEPLECFI